MIVRSDAQIIGSNDPDTGSADGKPATLVIAESNREHALVLSPGATPEGICQRLNLDPDETAIRANKAAEPFGKDENLYPLVPPGAVLYATTNVEAGYLR